MTDEEKLQKSVEAFKRKLDNIKTWDQMKNLIQNISPELVKTFLQTNISGDADSYRLGAEQNEITADEHDALAGEIGAL